MFLKNNIKTLSACKLNRILICIFPLYLNHFPESMWFYFRPHFDCLIDFAPASDALVEICFFMEWSRLPVNLRNFFLKEPIIIVDFFPLSVLIVTETQQFLKMAQLHF